MWECREQKFLNFPARYAFRCWVFVVTAWESECEFNFMDPFSQEFVMQAHSIQSSTAKCVKQIEKRKQILWFQFILEFAGFVN